MTVRLLGTEMIAWSDLDGEHGPGPVRGPALAALLGVAYGRTLVVGPHEPDLLDALSTAELTVLVRGVPDAEALAVRYADRPGVQVCCGGPETLAATPPYDTVVALDGLARLSSVEGAELTWGAAFDLLVALLRPGGRLLLGFENFLGAHRVLALPPEHTDSDWATLGEYDDTRPAGLRRLRDRLTVAGLRPIGSWAAFPAPLAPDVLLGTELLADAEMIGFLQATLGGSMAVEPATDAEAPLMLADPARLVGAAVRHGAAIELAPGWLLLAERLPSTADPAVLDEAPVPPRPAPPAAWFTQGGRLREVNRDPAGRWRFTDGETVPPGRTVEDLVVTATLRRDLPAVRALLTAWQAGAHADVPADQVVVAADGTWAALADPGGSAAALRRLAARLVDAGLVGLWPAGELTATLATMAGREPEASQATVNGNEPAVGGAGEGGWRELLLDRDRLARELAEARALHRWYEQTLTQRDDELKRLRRALSLLRGTPTARAARLLLATARTARRGARTTLHRLRRTD